ncbi:DEAD/DEAH box helicase [Litorihabitans aurantiacus]|uniref:DNA helicase n=1 Tax=Litorihabitans aurantiacus TaxID=1930061 RepID=A0AA38CS10_9MICO|nr:DEAD/DEAH box helicase [Litorihabitans aurantiacus]GMA33248.1 DNA helicase [Litorihabitans aurantiacus]
MHAPIELVGLVGRHAFDAGSAYARQHRAVVRRHDEQAHVVVGSVDGSGRNVYTATTYYGLTRNGTISSFDGRCSCPVQTDCKHTVALLVTALEQERAAAARTVEVGRWRSQLEGIFPDLGEQEWSPLALALQFVPPPDHTSDPRGRGGLGGYRAAHEGSLEARAMRLGKRGQWIATGAEWHAVTRNGIPDADPAQLEALTALVRLHQASDTYAYGVPTWLALQAVPSRALWPVLRDVVASGVQLLEPDGEHAALSDDTASAAVTVTSAEPDAPPMSDASDTSDASDASDLEVLATIDHPVTLTETLLLGRPVHGLVGRDPHGTLTLVPLEAPATRAWIDLRRAGAVRVPAAERPLFERTVLPRIRRQPWHAAGEFAPEEPPGPTLVVRVRLLFTALGSTPRASVECEWRYGAADNAFALTFTLPPDPRRPDRDATAENVLLHRAAAAMAAVPTLLTRDGLPLEEMVVTGHSVVALVEDVIPALLQVEGIEVDLPDEDLPTFRDLGEPEIAVDVVGTNRDWFDLEVRLRLTDRDVPVGHVITALARREQTLFLEDGGYISLERPELDQLRALLEEGRALQDQRRTGLRVSRLNLSWWEELQALGVIDAQASEWLDRVRAATSLEGDPPPVPAGLRAELRPYQRAGYEWLARLRRAGLGGVLADDMGLGKTLQTLAMILDAKDSGALTAPVPGGASDGDAATPRHRPFVVVAPTSVVPNWAAEAARFAPDLRVAVVTATGRKRRESIAELAAQADVIVTSYALFRLEHEEYEVLTPAGLVLDEAQNIKNRTSRGFALAKTLPADVKFVVTGTPMENNLAELWAMFAIAAPGLLGTPQQFTEVYSAPIERGNGVELGLFARLRTRIAPFLLRRTKEEVTPDLPLKQEQVLTVTLDPAHRKIYARHLGRERQRVLGLVKDMERNRVEVLSALTRLRQLAIDASLVDEEYDGVPSSKLDVLMPLLTEAAAEGHRALVFSQFTRYLGKIAARLDAEGIPYAYLDGSTTRRAAVIRGFAEGTAPVFLISLKAGGVGLNLAMADYCILADPWWNPAAEAQAVDRAHRIGQTRPVMVYRMVAQDTIEEKVMALQESKRALVAGVLGGGAADGDAGGAAPRRLDADDVRALLD